MDRVRSAHRYALLWPETLKVVVFGDFDLYIIDIISTTILMAAV
jgi:hypothetical protein